MKIVHVVTVPESLIFLRGHIYCQRDAGYEVHVVSSGGAPLDELARKTGATVHEVPLVRRISPVRDLAALLALVRLWRRLRPAIVHAHTPKAGLLTMLSGRAAGVQALIYHVHGLPYLAARGGWRLILRTAERIACRASHRVLSVSPSIAEVLVADRLCPPAKVAVPGHGSIAGIDSVRFAPEKGGASRRAIRSELGLPADAQVVGFVGRIVRDKGIAELNLAWQSLASAFPDAHLMLVGAVEESEATCRKLWPDLLSGTRVRFVPPREDVERYYRAMDLLVLPSHREGLGLAALEAGATELPVVATNIPGCCDAVVDGVTGTLIRPRDPDALTAAIAAYLRDPGLARLHGLNARARVQRLFRPIDLQQAIFAEYRALECDCRD